MLKHIALALIKDKKAYEFKIDDEEKHLFIDTPSYFGGGADYEGTIQGLVLFVKKNFPEIKSVDAYDDEVLPAFKKAGYEVPSMKKKK